MVERQVISSEQDWTTGLAGVLDRVVEGGAVVSGDVIIALAGVDLIRLDLKLMLVGADKYELDVGKGT
jgi:hypothetical protein